METENQNPFQLDVINLLAFNPFHNFPSLPTSRLYVRGTILGYKSFAGGMRVYICEHNTSPPGNCKLQLILDFQYVLRETYSLLLS
uniref:DET1- and DDB1-associated protein 1 n=1 Tax=Gossypium raimondii TaxID=29730 RepID=A0A0D2P3K5_GOSRA|nr:hypothetical protein B456_007G057300 [Gossypium raimondii]